MNYLFPCPHCKQNITVPEDATTCPECGKAIRIPDEINVNIHVDVTAIVHPDTGKKARGVWLNLDKKIRGKG